MSAVPPPQQEDTFQEERNLKVDRLPNTVTPGQLFRLFRQFGRIIDCRIITDRVSGTGKGFGFVVFETREAAHNATRSLHNSQQFGRRIHVAPAKGNYAREVAEYLRAHEHGLPIASSSFLPRYTEEDAQREGIPIPNTGVPAAMPQAPQHIPQRQSMEVDGASVPGSVPGSGPVLQVYQTTSQAYVPITVVPTADPPQHPQTPTFPLAVLPQEISNRAPQAFGQHPHPGYGQHPEHLHHTQLPHPANPAGVAQHTYSAATTTSQQQDLQQLRALEERLQAVQDEYQRKIHELRISTQGAVETAHHNHRRTEQLQLEFNEHCDKIRREINIIRSRSGQSVHYHIR